MSSLSFYFLKNTNNEYKMNNWAGKSIVFYEFIVLGLPVFAYLRVRVPFV